MEGSLSKEAIAALASQIAVLLTKALHHESERNTPKEIIELQDALRRRKKRTPGPKTSPEDATQPELKTKKQEKRRRRKRQPQCRWCQQLGHTQFTCEATTPTCGVCAEAHATTKCIAAMKEGHKPSRKCALCGNKGHSAPSYTCPARSTKKTKPTFVEVSTQTDVIYVRDSTIQTEPDIRPLSFPTIEVKDPTDPKQRRRKKKAKNTCLEFWHEIEAWKKSPTIDVCFALEPCVEKATHELGAPYPRGAGVKPRPIPVKRADVQKMAVFKTPAAPPRSPRVNDERRRAKSVPPSGRSKLIRLEGHRDDGLSKDDIYVSTHPRSMPARHDSHPRKSKTTAMELLNQDL